MFTTPVLLSSTREESIITSQWPLPLPFAGEIVIQGSPEDATHSPSDDTDMVFLPPTASNVRSDSPVPKGTSASGVTQADTAKAIARDKSIVLYVFISAFFN